MSSGADISMREREKMNIKVNDVRLGIEHRGAGIAIGEGSVYRAERSGADIAMGEGYGEGIGRKLERQVITR